MVIGAQKGPTSARKTDPPGFRGTPAGTGRRDPPLALWSGSWRASGVRSGRRVKRSLALRGRNPTRDSPADGAPKAPPAHAGGRGAFSRAFGHRSHASENPTVAPPPA